MLAPSKLPAGVTPRAAVTRSASLGPHHPGHFLPAPDVVLAFHSFTVRIPGGIKAPLGGSQLPQDKIQGLARDAPGQFAFGQLVVRQVDRRQEGIVVEHLLKMRHHPGRVHAVAVEAPAQLVVDAAPGHLLQGEGQLRQDRGLPGEMIIVEQKIQFQGPGKFRGAAQPAIHRVEIFQEAVRCGLQGFPGGVAAAPPTSLSQTLHVAFHLQGERRQLLAILLVGLAEGQQQARETRQAAPVFGGK